MAMHIADSDCAKVLLQWFFMLLLCNLTMEQAKQIDGRPAFNIHTPSATHHVYNPQQKCFGKVSCAGRKEKSATVGLIVEDAVPFGTFQDWVGVCRCIPTMLSYKVIGLAGILVSVTTSMSA